MTMYKMLHKSDDVGRLYVARKYERKKFTWTDECLDGATQNIQEFTKNDQR